VQQWLTKNAFHRSQHKFTKTVFILSAAQRQANLRATRREAPM
jgi:hypothetical protein